MFYTEFKELRKQTEGCLLQRKNCAGYYAKISAGRTVWAAVIALMMAQKVVGGSATVQDWLLRPLLC